MGTAINYIKKIFISPTSEAGESGHSINNQKKKLKEVYSGEKCKSYGVERVFKLFLLLQSFFFPGIWYRQILSGNTNKIRKKMVIESYVILKVVLGLLLLFKIKYFSFESWLSIYLIMETLLYLLSIIFLETIHKKAVSFSRSLLLLFLNYLETVIYFAVIYKSYWYKNEIIENASNPEIIKSLDALYFSFMTATTVGYGDIIPPNINIKMVCIAQTIIMLIFAMLFFNKFVSSLNVEKH